MFEPEGASLNQRSEFFAYCYHQRPTRNTNSKIAIFQNLQHIHIQIFQNLQHIYTKIFNTSTQTTNKTYLFIYIYVSVKYAKVNPVSTFKFSCWYCQIFPLFNFEFCNLQLYLLMSGQVLRNL